jgi:hypothetical protein
MCFASTEQSLEATIIMKSRDEGVSQNQPRNLASMPGTLWRKLNNAAVGVVAALRGLAEAPNKTFPKAIKSGSKGQIQEQSLIDGSATTFAPPITVSGQSKPATKGRN